MVVEGVEPGIVKPNVGAVPEAVVAGAVDAGLDPKRFDRLGGCCPAAGALVPNEVVAVDAVVGLNPPNRFVVVAAGAAAAVVVAAEAAGAGNVLVAAVVPVGPGALGANMLAKDVCCCCVPVAPEVAVPVAAVDPPNGLTVVPLVPVPKPLSAMIRSDMDFEAGKQHLYYLNSHRAYYRRCSFRRKRDQSRQSQVEQQVSYYSHHLD